jgi:hypothetical protein
MISQATFGDDPVSDVVGALTHPADTLSAVAKAAVNAVNVAGSVVTHPSDDFNAAISATANPDEAFGKVINSISPETAKFLHDNAAFMRDKFGDFARTDVGREFLDVAAGAAYVGTMFSFGPLALTVWAVPGLLRGEPFTHAWLEGCFTQIERAAKALSAGNVDINVLPADTQNAILGYAQQFASQIQTAHDYLSSLPGGVGDLAYDKLAEQLDIGEDAAMAALANAGQNAAALAFPLTSFDPVTHKVTALPTIAKIEESKSAGMATRKAARMLPDYVMLALQNGAALAGKNAVYSAARALASSSTSPADYRDGFDIGLGLSLAAAGASGIHGPPMRAAMRTMSGASPTVKQSIAVGIVDPRMLIDRNNAAKMAAARALLTPEAQRGYDAGVALYNGRLRQGATFAFNGTAQQAAGFLTTAGLAGSGDPHGNVAVMQAVAANPAARQGAETALAAQEGWFTRLLHWVGL